MLTVAVVQDAPVFLDPRATTERVLLGIRAAHERGAELVAFGETFLPGYPFWLSDTGGARFDDAAQKEVYARYLEAAVRVDGPEIRAVIDLARELQTFVVLGVAERGPGPASGSIYCTALAIDPARGLVGHHRKLVPTHEERLVWAPGDGHGLRVHEFRGVKVSALNCWENWMPLARHALYAQGTEVHVALWPGAVRNTIDATRMIAREGRVFVVSACGLLARTDVPHDFPVRDALPPHAWFHDGGSAIAAPDGSFVLEPCPHRRDVLVARLDLREVARERQNFDPTGHYARPDVFNVEIDRRRKPLVGFVDD